eukprot:COSAG05_NODE_2851_length_2571_cov_29.580150_3_plen_69_part_00
MCRYEPRRSILHFEIGKDRAALVGPWPVRDADANATEFTIMNTDSHDPPCIDLCTPAARCYGLCPYNP